jgi:dihydroflavonol-4-reductase
MRLAGNVFFVTGATGFVGSMIAKELCSRGYEVHILRREGSVNPLLDSLPVHTHIGNVLEREHVRKAMEGCTAVFHCAGVVSYWRKTRKRQYDVNVTGTDIVSSAALELGVRRFVHTSSVAALGPAADGGKIDEETPFDWYRHGVGYNISKHEAELRVLEKIKKGLDAVFVNPATIVGPGDVNMHGSALIETVMRARLPFYIDIPMNIVDIDDVVRGHLLAFEKGKTGERYLLCGHSLHLGDLLKLIESIAGGTAPRYRVPFPLAQFTASIVEWIGTKTNRKPGLTRELLLVGRYRQDFSCAKAERELGYERTPVDETIRKTAEWLKQKL